MSFQEQARQAMRNGGSDDMRRRELLSAVEWNCSRLKAAILNQISRGEHTGSRVCGVYDIPFDGNWDDSVPYGNLFAAEWDTDGKRRGGLISFHDISRQSLVIRDLNRLDEFSRLFSELAHRDGISLGEPFLRAVFSSSKTNEFVREKRFSRGMRSLSAHVRTDERLFGAQRYGERAALLLSVDYVCTVR